MNKLYKYLFCGTDFVFWTDVKNIKPIINCDTNEFC